MLDDGRLLTVLFLARKFGKRGSQSIRVTSLEKDKIFRNLAGGILLDGVIDAVFPGYTVKSLDILLRDLDIGHALILTDQFLYRLFSGGLHNGFCLGFFFPVGEILGDRLFQNIGGQF